MRYLMYLYIVSMNWLKRIQYSSTSTQKPRQWIIFTVGVYMKPVLEDSICKDSESEDRDELLFSFDYSEHISL